jgi:hypothetical protein
MNTIQKTIISVYAVALVLSIMADNGLAQMAGGVLILGTPLALLLLFLWRSKKENA